MSLVTIQWAWFFCLKSEHFEEKITQPLPFLEENSRNLYHFFEDLFHFSGQQEQVSNSNGPKSLQEDNRRGRSPRSAPNSRPQSSTRSVSRSRLRAASQLPPNNGPASLRNVAEPVYETMHSRNDPVTSPLSSSRSSRLSNGLNYHRDSGNDTMYTSSGTFKITPLCNLFKASMHF